MKWSHMVVFSMLMIGSINTWAAEDWIKIAASPDLVYAVKAGSVRIAKNDGDVGVVVAMGRVTGKKTDKIQAAQWYVTIDHCKLQQGNLVITDMVGTYVSDVQFVFKLGTVASEIAEFLCLSAPDKTSGYNKSNI